MMSESYSRLPHRAANVVSGALLAVLSLASVTSFSAQEAKKRPAPPTEGVWLFAGPYGRLDGNQLQCEMDNAGRLCTLVFDNFGSGFWPRGTRNRHSFSTALQVAGIYSGDAGPWAGDTAGAYFGDARGSQLHGGPLADVFNSVSPDDLNQWPPEGLVTDAELFGTNRLGNKAVSEQDSWTRYWDGDPSRNSNREHPAGFQVSQRSMAWNYPLGNESIIYYVFRIENVTGGVEFQSLNETEFFAGADELPDAGWRIDSVYVGVFADFDVSSSAGTNFSTSVPSFDLALTYESSMGDSQLTYPEEYYRFPFFPTSPGFIGVSFLQTPPDDRGKRLGQRLFSVYHGTSSAGASFVAPTGVSQLWRYLSAQLEPALGDPPCDVTATLGKERLVCARDLTSRDTRLYTSTGPFSLEPGTPQTIVASYAVSATVTTLPDGTPSGINANSTTTNDNAPGIPSAHPGFESRRGCDLTGTICTDVLTALQNPVQIIERGMGWVNYTGPPPASPLELEENKLDPTHVETVAESMLRKVQIARTIVENQFLLPSAPAAPTFHLVPGDGQVSVIWNPSASEQAGDPFFSLASDSGSPVYNPNYRQFDVHGYRLLRGTTHHSLETIAEFRYGGQTFEDRTCETVPPDDNLGVSRITAAGDTVMVVGYAAGELCPLADSAVTRSGFVVFNNGRSGGVPGGGTVRLENLKAQAIALDTLQVAGNGIPFVFKDSNVTNEFTYFYAVTAFDLNSPASGPPSFESERVVQAVVPRLDAANLELATLDVSVSGDDGVPLNPDAAVPTIDAETGVFSGPMPPSDAFTLSFAPLVERLLPAFTRSARIDSVVPVRGTGASPAGTPTGLCPNGANPFGACWKMYLTADNNGVLTPVVVESYTPWWSAFREPAIVENIPLLNSVVLFDPQALAQFGIQSGEGAATATAITEQAIDNSAAIGPQARRFGARLQHGGSRWFDGSVETGDFGDPAAYIRQGHLAAADTVWAPNSHTRLDANTLSVANFEKQCFVRAVGYMSRAADVRFTWGGGTFSEVRDVTHNVPVRFSPKVRPTWGFLMRDANGNGLIDWQDFNFLDPVLQIVRGVTGGNCDDAAGTMFDPGGTAQTVTLEASPRLVPTSTEGLQQAGIAGLTQTGTGFGLYVNGQRFIFEMNQLPADGTIWTLRSYQGRVRSSRATESSPDPDGYRYRKVGPSGTGLGIRPPLVPGLSLNFASGGVTLAEKSDISEIHTVPNPYLFGTLDAFGQDRRLRFVNLPAQATIRIYSLAGRLVDQIHHDDPTDSGTASWDLRNRTGLRVASGVYFFHVIDSAGQRYVGKFVVVH